MKSQEGSKPAERLNGSEILVRALAEEGVEYVFGYPGGSVLNIFDAIYKQDKFKHILVRHEQGAAHAADAYSRASNKVGVALVTSGPGATNAVTGIAVPAEKQKLRQLRTTWLVIATTTPSMKKSQSLSPMFRRLLFAEKARHVTRQ